MESSQSTTCHIKQFASDPQVVQVNLMRQQLTDLPPSKSKQKKPSDGSRSNSHKKYSSEHNHQMPPYKKRFDPNQAYQRKDRCSKCDDSKHIEGFKCPAREFQARPEINILILQTCATKRKYMQENSICSQSGDLTSSDESFCLQVKIQFTQANVKILTCHHLITNLAYRLKPHHKRNTYLRARLDICADVNIMPASVYKPVF